MFFYQRTEKKLIQNNFKIFYTKHARTRVTFALVEKNKSFT